MLANAQQDIRIVYAEKERIRLDETHGPIYGPVIRSVYLLECCTDGEGSVTINGKTFFVSAGVCYALMPGDVVSHYSNPSNVRQGFWCAIDGDTIGPLLAQLGITSENPCFPPALYPRIHYWLEQLVLHWERTDAGAPMRQLSCLYGLLGELLESCPRPLSGTAVDRAVGYMQTNYPEALTVDSIAAQAGLERTYFSETFKKHTGLTPYRYLTRLRLQKACHLLDTRRYSISEVAYLVGLEPHNFARLFKKEIGSTPQEYVRHVRQGCYPLEGRVKPTRE